MHSYFILGCEGTEAIVSTLSSQLSINSAVAVTSKFPNEESRIQVPDYGETTFLIGSLSHPVNSRIIEYLLAADALKRMGARHIVGVLAWYPYSKQDKVFLPGEPLSAKVMASLFQSVSIKELVTLDLHNPSITGYFDIPVTNLSALPLFIARLKQQDLTDTYIVAPDAGSIKNAVRISQELATPMAIATKTRDLHTGQVKITDLSTNIKGKNILIFDDMIATGSTLIEISEFLKQRGAKTINVYCTHHLYIKGVQEKIDEAPIDSLCVTNSIEKPEEVDSLKLDIMDVSPVFRKEIEAKIFSHG